MLRAQGMLARDRSQFAREMPDAVSHQISPIAVQAAGAMCFVAEDTW